MPGLLHLFIAALCVHVGFAHAAIPSPDHLQGTDRNLFDHLQQYGGKGVPLPIGSRWSAAMAAAMASTVAGTMAAAMASMAAAANPGSAKSSTETGMGAGLFIEGF